MQSRDAASTSGRCLCDERGLLGDHEKPCAGFGSRSDELCEQAEREATAAGDCPDPSAATDDHPQAVCKGLAVKKEPLVETVTVHRAR